MCRPVLPRRWSPWFLAGALASAAITVTISWAGEVRGDQAWHADVQAACAASAASGRPVLAVFEASWDAAATGPAADVLSNAEVKAVVEACFEPVRLDVDQHAALARELAVEHVPAARVLDHEATVLAGFDCPASPSAFVAAAARAAQVAATTSASPNAATTAAAEATDDFGVRQGPKAHETAAAVSQKVRQLANFADGDPSNPSVSDRFAGAAAPVAPATDPVVGSRYAEPLTSPALASTSPALASTPPALASTSPALASTSPAWPAERAFVAPPAQEPAAPIAAPPATASIAVQPASSTPWLAGTPAAAGPGAAPAAAADPSPPAAQGAGVAADAATTTEGGSQSAAKPATGFWAAIQKPLSVFAKKPASDPNPAAAGAESIPSPPTMPPATPQSPAALAAGAPVPDTLGPMPLGLEGYCPVTVVERGSWVEGRPQWGARHRGRTYLFSGPEQQQAFLSDPDRYAPALSGDDPVLAFESGRSEPGRRAYGVSYQSRMYLFSSPESRAAFTADPDRYTARVMIAEGAASADGVRRV